MLKTNYNNDNDKNICPNYLKGLLHQLNDITYLANYNA